MDFPSHINKQPGTSSYFQLHTVEMVPLSIPLVRNDINAEKLHLTPLPSGPSYLSPSHVGAESFDWVLCYSDDIYKHWRRMEQKQMIVKCYPNIGIVRPLLINIMRNLQKNYGLANTTLHLAVYILDNFLSRNSQNVEIKLMVITAIVVAAKVEDVDMRVPRFAELNRKMLNSSFSLMDYRNLEAKMLICLDFNLTVPTVATFANYFSRISVVLEDFHIYQKAFDKNNGMNISDERIMYVLFERYDEMLATVNKLLLRLIDYTMDSTTLLNMLPSRKAAACIAAARWLYNVQPVWTPFLEMQSSYSESEIFPVMEAIISIYDIRGTSDSSYESSSPTDDDYKNLSSSTDSSPYIS